MISTNDSAVKGFVSYSHEDAVAVKALMGELNGIIEDGALSIWYDRMIEPGTKWKPEIEEQLNASELIVFCISKAFLESESCRYEFKKAIELKRDKNAEILLVIMSESQWAEDEEISSYQAVPEYGKPVAGFTDAREAYDQIKAAIRDKIRILDRRRNLTMVDSFENELQSIDPLLSISGSEHLNLRLEDIYVDPELNGRHEEGKVTETILGSALVDKLADGCKLIVSGVSQSGKTSLCRAICLELFRRHYLPIYVDSQDGYNGNLSKQIDKIEAGEYSDPECVRNERRILILDDFYKCRKMEQYLASLPKCCSVLVVLDDVYELNMRNASVFKEFESYSLIPMRALKRNELIKKWIASQAEEGNDLFDNYKHQDALTSRVEQTLGRMFGKGLIPAYPFYILAILITTEVAGKPLNKEITSQGYCYQALLYAVLWKVGVRNQHMDIYVNFLTELAYMLFKKMPKGKCTEEELAEFIKKYQEDFNLPISANDILEKLEKGKIFGADSFSFYDFKYPYLKYYFIAKYLVEHYETCNDDCMRVFSHLGSVSNAYVAIFMSHHDRSVAFLGNIESMLSQMFKGAAECYLTRADLKEFDEQSKLIVQAALPSANVDPEKEREKFLVAKEKREAELVSENAEDEDPNSPLRNFIAAMRLCQVMGMILKSRPGSIPLLTQKRLLLSVVNVYARILREYLNLVKDEEAKAAVIECITFAIKKSPVGAKRRESDVRDLAIRTFWNLSFVATHNLMIHCVGAIGSDELCGVIGSACEDKKDAPLMMIIPFVTEIIFKKRVDVDAMRKVFPALPPTVRAMLKLVVARFCTIHQVDYDCRQKVEQLFDLSNTLSKYLSNR